MALITNLQPPAGTAVAASGAVSFDVIDPVVEELKVFVWVVFKATGAVELVYDGAAFQAMYSASQISAVTGGRRFSVRRVGGWPSTPELRVDTCACPPDLVSAGEINTGANVGGFAEVFQLKLGYALQFRTLRSSDSSIAIAQNLTNLDLTLPDLTVVDTFANNTTLDIEIADITADTAAFVHLSLWNATTGEAAAYEVAVAADAAARTEDINTIQGATPMTTVGVSTVLVGNIVYLRLAGSGAGSTVKATHRIVDLFAK